MRASLIAALAGGLALTSLPNTAAAEQVPAASAEVRGTAPQSEVLRYPPSSVRVPLVVGGLGVLGAAYGLSVASALTWDDVPGADAMLIPVVGPWVSLVQTGCAPDDPDCGAILVLRSILLVVDGLAQVGGVGLIGEGLFMTTEAGGESADTGLMVLPDVGPERTGLQLVGTF